MLKVKICATCRYSPSDLKGNYCAGARTYLCLDCPVARDADWRLFQILLPSPSPWRRREKAEWNKIRKINQRARRERMREENAKLLERLS
jgi:hypothetical protein